MLEQLLESDRLIALKKALQAGQSLLIEGLWNAPKALIAALAQQSTGKHVLILTGGSQEEIRLFHDFPFFTDRSIIDFPAWETLPSENVAPSPDIIGERYKALHEITNSSRPAIILSGLQACLQKLLPPKQLASMYKTLQTGCTCSFDDLITSLIGLGYKRSPIASEKGEFAVRGGIIDIFPVSSPDPFRLEFWGDEIESMRMYDPIGQKSVKSADKLELHPAQEMELIQSTKNLSTILDYLGPNTLVIFDDLLALEDRYTALISMSGIPSATFCSIDQFMGQVDELQKIYWSTQPIEDLSAIKLLNEKQKKSYYSASNILQPLTFEMFNRSLPASRWQHAYRPLDEYLLPEQAEASGQELLFSLSKLTHKEVQLHLLCSTPLEQENLHKRILDAGITLPKRTQNHLAYLSSGFVDTDLQQIFLPMTEITHRYKIRRQKQRSTYHTLPVETYDFIPGELVVHLNHGIGKYLGIEKKPNNAGVPTEFLIVEYAENGKLYIPLNQAHLLSKYIGAHEELPKMHTLGSNRWKTTRERTEQAIQAYASDVLEHYARREMAGGFACQEDGPDTKAFEEDFPFVETEDQLAAIAGIKADMTSPKAMDRLICGDVGYGKTEVAMRAAFKAVADGKKQVAVLVPTTVLAMQHYETFVDRMANFPINIGVLSRFRTAKQIRETLEGAAQGTIDIVIGTHRIISEDVLFKDLGLVIIDEEQRFGVKAKEHLKKIKMGVDCLTLSATPIPRTLYMSLIGARDMSIINTPPQDRLPITTIIAEPNDQVLKNALLRELARDGQVYIIHNRVESIYSVADHVKTLLPQARVLVGHGQMSSDEIDSVFHTYKKGDADVLVATTIVENGIDIPNANTILINRADHFGLADLYQLRGRVGRWNRRAYAYFLVPKLHLMPELARKRLNALAASSGYGGGMKIAMHDLEIRGAGNMLGLEQSGHVSAIGFHLYCKMLKRTMQTLQGKMPAFLADARIDFPVDARLPEDYINAPSLRMEFYQRLGEASSFEDVEALWAELQDRFGTPPAPAEWLYALTRLRIHAGLNRFTLIRLEKTTLSAEQIKNNQTISKKSVFSLPKQPLELEGKVLKALGLS